MWLAEKGPCMLPWVWGHAKADCVSSTSWLNSHICVLDWAVGQTLAATQGPCGLLCTFQIYFKFRTRKQIRPSANNSLLVWLVSHSNSCKSGNWIFIILILYDLLIVFAYSYDYCTFLFLFFSNVWNSLTAGARDESHSLEVHRGLRWAASQAHFQSKNCEKKLQFKHWCWSSVDWRNHWEDSDYIDDSFYMV